MSEMTGWRVVAVGRLYEALARGDLDLFCRHLTPAVRWHIPWCGVELAGRQDVREWFTSAAESLLLTHDVADLIDRPPFVMAISVVGLRLDGRVRRSPGIDVHRFEGDRVAEGWSILHPWDTTPDQPRSRPAMSP